MEDIPLVDEKKTCLILPAGTVVRLRGFPVELSEDTQVYSVAIQQMGLETFLSLTQDDSVTL